MVHYFNFGSFFMVDDRDKVADYQTTCWLKVAGLGLGQGLVTSVNPNDRSAYFAFDDRAYGNHTKLRLRYDRAYELTEANSRIYAKVAKYQGQIKEIEDKIRSLLSKLEKPVGKARRAYIRARLLVERAREEARRELEKEREKSGKCPGSIYRPIRER